GRHLAHVHLEDLLATAHVGQAHHHLAIEATRTQQRGIEHVGAVRRGDHDDAFRALETVHLDQQLVQRLLALVMTAAEAGAAMAADRVDLVDEDDAGRMLLGLLEHVAYAAGAHAHEHLHEVRAGDREERHLGLARDGLGQQGLAGTGWAHHQHAARDLAAQLLELGRIAQELDQLADLLLGLVATGHVVEVDLDLVLALQLGPRTAEAHRTTPAAAGLHLAHEPDEHANYQQHRQPAHQQAQQREALGRVLAYFHALVLHLLHHLVGGEAQHRRHRAVARTVLQLAADGGWRVGADHRAGDVAVGHALHEARVGHVRRPGAVRVEALEHGEQHHRDDDPEQHVFRCFVHARFPPGCTATALRPVASAYTSRERAREAFGLRIVTREKSTRKLRM